MKYIGREAKRGDIIHAIDGFYKVLGCDAYNAHDYYLRALHVTCNGHEVPVPGDEGFFTWKWYELLQNSIFVSRR